MNYKHKAVRDLLNLCLRGRKRHEVRTHEFILNDFLKNYLFGIRTPVIPLCPPPRMTAGTQGSSGLLRCAGKIDFYCVCIQGCSPELGQDSSTTRREDLGEKSRRGPEIRRKPSKCQTPSLELRCGKKGGGPISSFLNASSFCQCQWC